MAHDHVLGSALIPATRTIRLLVKIFRDIPPMEVEVPEQELNLIQIRKRVVKQLQKLYVERTASL